MMMTLKHKTIFAFTDTHGRHSGLGIPENMDILVCAGDVCEDGDEAQLQDFFAWFAALPANHKLFVPGNHDLPFDLDPEHAVHYIPKGVAYVENGGVTLGGVRFYVLPVRPWLHRENVPPFLPRNVDALVTHGAPQGIMDGDERWGCPILREITNKIQPKIHIFGHYHQSDKQEITVGNTRFYNVAIV